MSVLATALVPLAESESYTDLLRSGPHWLFELTLEAVTTPLAFAIGWVWQKGILRHVHEDLHAVSRDRVAAPPAPPAPPAAPAGRSRPHGRGGPSPDDAGYSVSVTRVTYARCPRAAARTPVRGGPPARGRRV
ncbi:hypothetical protein G5V58_11610 [Nocardioides anomalus]|uniref:Uncharacterized protein n=1 Tax=Nocardioides anomalus TaxID=2712223 RepID=A0A6G6WDU5_9ACTN|nr:hypothetical protein [Nocardioides anomalus]QIG43323.1 hypothetical protein G5V58_11610 [Nocardioides anomalus]